MTGDRVKMTVLMVLLAMLLVCGAQAQSGCSCYQRCFVFLYAIKIPVNQDPTQIPGFTGTKVVKNGCTDALAYVNRCICDIEQDILSDPSALLPGYSDNYFPVAINFDPNNLDDFHSYATSCFDKEEAFECIEHSVQSWNSICSQNTGVNAELQWSASTLGSYGVFAEHDATRFRNAPNALAITTVRHFWDCDNNKLLIMRPSTDKHSIYFNMSKPVDFASHCPCVDCDRIPSFSFCKVLQHEIGHLFNLNHLEPLCPIPTEQGATMNPSAISCNTPPFDEAMCNDKLTCNDLCYFCMINCPEDCRGVSGIIEFEANVSDSGVSMYLYPNPTRKKINIRIHASHNEDCILTIFSALGQMNYSHKFRTNNSDYKLSPEYEFRTPGYYFAVLRYGEKTLTSRIVVK
jgi:hypothetical protein